MAHSNHGITRHKAEEQPADKERARTAHQTDSAQSVSREATRDPSLNDRGRKPGSGKASDQRRGDK
jgi:hypothetical protein